MGDSYTLEDFTANYCITLGLYLKKLETAESKMAAHS